MTLTTFSSAFLDDLSTRAESLPRRRLHSNVHKSYQEPVQRLFNAIGIDSYIHPHRHSLQSGQELLLAMRGRMALVTFDDTGSVLCVTPFGQSHGGDVAENVGVELPSGLWHTVVAEVSGSVLFEAKRGPFQPDQAKELAEWAPAEGTAEAEKYFLALRNRIFVTP